MTTRRIFLSAFAGAFAAPFTTLAQQQGKVWRVGFLTGRGRPASLDSDYYGGFTRGMRDLGYVEGKNLIVEWRFADGRNENFPKLAAELVQLKVDALVVAGTPSARAAQRATAVIPIVMGNTTDPVESGLIKSLARPGANTTGVSNLSGETSPKLLEMLRAMAPKVGHIAVLVNPVNLATFNALKHIQAAAPKIKAEILPVEIRAAGEIESAFSAMVRSKAGALIVPIDGLFIDQQNQIAKLCMKYRLPSIAAIGGYVDGGGLMNYGPNFTDSYRRVAYYVDRIFKGAKPADLPVEQPTIFELVINGKAAKALGLTIPTALMISSNRVIE